MAHNRVSQSASEYGALCLRETYAMLFRLFTNVQLFHVKPLQSPSVSFIFSLPFCRLCHSTAPFVGEHLCGCQQRRLIQLLAYDFFVLSVLHFFSPKPNSFESSLDVATVLGLAVNVSIASLNIHFSLEHIMQRKLFSRRQDDIRRVSLSLAALLPTAVYFNGILFLYLFAHYVHDVHNFSFIFCARQAWYRRRAQLVAVFFDFHFFGRGYMCVYVWRSRSGLRCFIWNIYQPFIDFIHFHSIAIYVMHVVLREHFSSSPPPFSFIA